MLSTKSSTVELADHTPKTADASWLDGHSLLDCVTVRSMVNIARLTIWSIYCSWGGSEGRADPLIVAPFIGAA